MNECALGNTNGALPATLTFAPLQDLRSGGVRRLTSAR